MDILKKHQVGDSELNRGRQAYCRKKKADEKKEKEYVCEYGNNGVGVG